MRAAIISALIVITMFLPVSLPGAHAAEGEPPVVKTADEGRIVEEVLFEVHGYPGPKSRIMAMARDLVPLRQGDAFSERSVSRSVSYLRRSGRFEEVSAAKAARGEGVSVIFRMRPCLQIRDIKVSGEYPLFERDILNVMTVHAGSFLRDDTPAGQAELVRQYLATEGYPDAEVKVENVDTMDDGTAILRVEIHKGSFYSLASLEVEGTRRSPGSGSGPG